MWRSVEMCGGQVGNFDAVEWYVTEGSAGANGEPGIAGSYWPSLNRIYLNEDFVADEPVVRHEMLHALLGGATHEPAFLNECGDVVTCIENCISEAGGRGALPTAASDTVMPASLEVTITIVQPVSGENGWASIIVSARNPSTQAVWVDLSGDPGETFACLLTGFNCTTHFFGYPSPQPFRAGETRRRAYVFQSMSGAYQIVGKYNTKQSSPDTLVVP